MSMSVANAGTLIVDTNKASNAHRKTNDSILYIQSPPFCVLVFAPRRVSCILPSVVCMRNLRQLVLVSLWILLAMPLRAQIAGFTGPDDDHDGLPDNFEQAILEKFKPTWKISPTDCDILPAEFQPGLSNPTVKAKNGTIYGQVFIRGTGVQGFFVEAHFYDLWGEDCGYINSHSLDAEHVSVLIRVLDPSQPLSEWHA